FRELSSFKDINGKNFKITVRNLIVESEDILIAIILSYVLIILSVFLIQFYFNRAKNVRLWTPFFLNLEAMKRFSLSSDDPISLVESEILEFSDLNKEITTLIDKVRADYQNLKQFTEDMSHELQTPLAIIQAKIENIINGDNLNELQFGHLTSIQKDIQRLTQMNKRLTLLTKIENRQFVKVEAINVSELIQETIQNFHEISNTEIKFSQKNEIIVNMDTYLAEVLCNNLISNAIKYSPQEGRIEVSASEKSLSVSNEGIKALEHPERLYSRFYRESEAVKSTGLGLAIVKRICDFYLFEIHYSFQSSKHIFTVKFI
ncbi:MAG TPA: HAMP domain-containing sensor histidine kinase, partial [Pricia sp.]|nr:HAMP domain-containing sensor histidine kinase [Pricia sp.]